MSIVKIQGNDFDGEIRFKDAKKAFEFYFEQCKDDRFTFIYHTDEEYEFKENLN